MRVFDRVAFGLTAKALQPNGMIPIIDGLSPDTISYDDLSPPGGVEVRLSMSTAWSTAKSQKYVGADAATRVELACVGQPG
eukprot:1687123-Pleurochrysis_carterae.AAC.1